MELTPDDEFAWGVRGYTYRMLERDEEAVADFTQAITTALYQEIYDA